MAGPGILAPAMCTFLTFGVPARTPAELLVDAFDGGVHPIEHPRAGEWFGEDVLYFQDRSHCNCGTEVGRDGGASATSAAAKEPWIVAKERAARRRLAKKERAAHRSQCRSVPRSDVDGSQPSAGEWAERLHAVLDAGVRWIGLLLHDYEGSTKDEPQDVERVDEEREVLSATTLRRLRADVLHVFHAEPVRPGTL